MIGERVRRVEDPRLITGRGCYVDDVPAPGALHLAIVRSPHAHARITSIDAGAARTCAGVLDVFSPEDLPELEDALPPRATVGVRIKPYRQSGLAQKLVRFAGEPVAVVVATSAYAAADGAERVRVEYEPLPAITTIGQTLAPDAPVIHADWGDNVAGVTTVATGDLARARAESAAVVSRRLVFNRLAATAIEPRAVVARWDPAAQTLTMWATTQIPGHVRESVARLLHVPDEHVRVIAPDVGGGFGPKGTIYPEYMIAATLARRLDRPVRWTETRTESFVSTTHAGDQEHHASLGARADGTFTFLEDDFTLDGGVYLPGGGIAANNTATHLMGLYRFDAFRCGVRVGVTHKAANRPYRGAGRAEAVFVLERLIDVLARKLGIDPAELRRRNLITPAELPLDRGIPYRDGAPVIYDSGDYPRLFETALARADYAGFRERQRVARAKGRLLGIGLATYNEGTGIGPEERATVMVGDDGGVTVHVGSPSQGQSHATTLGQICAERLGVPFARVSVLGVDTSRFVHPSGTYASRICVVLGSAVALAADAVREKAVRLAAAQLECDARDVVVGDGVAHVRGVPECGLSFAALSVVARSPEAAALLGEAGLCATRVFSPESVTWAPGAHAATVEVDRDTGAVSVLAYCAVHDVGREVNPAVVDGQVHGGVVQGLGIALSERILYDESGQVLTGSLTEYGLPRAGDVPHIDVAGLETPSPRNPLGVKGAGEGSVAPAAAAITNAICDALAEYGAEIDEMPVRAENVARLMKKVAG
jgi:aerobic carbon-monoxide dehydrogenase large subunit